MSDVTYFVMRNQCIACLVRSTGLKIHDKSPRVKKFTVIIDKLTKHLVDRLVVVLT